jgi:hypothetical protein
MRATATSPRSLLASPPRGWKDKALKRDEIDALSPVALKRKQFQSDRPKRQQQLGKLMEDGAQDPATAQLQEEMDTLSAASLEIEVTRSRQRLLAVQEIVSTEKTYVDQLLLLIKVPVQRSCSPPLFDPF